MSATGLVDEQEPQQGIHKKKKNKGHLVINYDEDARKEFLTGFRKRKQERRRVAKEALAEKDRIARREAKKHRKLEMLRAYGVEVQEHVVAAPADGGDVKEATYDAADTAITVRSNSFPTKKVAGSVKEEEELQESGSGGDEQSGSGEEADTTGADDAKAKTSARPEDWKKVRHERHPPKKRSWSKTKAKKIRKHNKRESKSKGRH